MAESLFYGHLQEGAMVISLIVLFFVGSVVGVLSSFFGIGGGLVAMPAMYILFSDMPAQMVIGTSLLMALLNSLRNLRAFIKKGLIPDIRFILPLIVFIVSGSFLGKLLVHQMSTEELKKIFSVFLVLVILKLLFYKPSTEINNETWAPKTKVLRSAFIGIVLGFISVMIGVGGGVVAVPLFIALFAMPLKWVPVYSNSVMVISTISGVLVYLNIFQHELGKTPFANLSYGSVNFIVSFILFLGGSLSYKWGIQYQDKLRPIVKKRLFALLLFIVAIKISGVITMI